MLPRRPRGKRGPMTAERARVRGRWSCWGGRPPTASLCQNEVVEISNEGAVRGQSYPHWYGHVQERFSAAWGKCGRAAGAAQEAAATAAAWVLREAASHPNRH